MKKIEGSDQDKQNLISRRNYLFDNLCQQLPQFYSENFQIEKSERYWKLLFYRFLIPFSEYYCTCEYLHEHTDFSQFCTGELEVPQLDRQQEEFSYQHIYNTATPLDIDGLKAMKPSDLQRSGVKSKLKDLLYNFQAKLHKAQPKLLLFSEFMPEAWTLIYPELKLVKPKFTNSHAGDVKIDVALRKSLREFLIKSGAFDTSFINAFVRFFPMDYIENLKHHVARMARIPQVDNVNQIVFGWIPDIVRRLYAGEILEKNSDCRLSIIQHGGTYGEYDHSLWEKTEKELSDQFFSWSQRTYDHLTVPMPPTRLLKFREKYNKRKLENKVSVKYDMLIVDGMQNKTINFFDLQGLNAKEADLTSFVKARSNGKGEGILLRVYDRRGVVDEEYIPRIRATFPDITIHTQVDALIDDMLMSRELYVNYQYSTFKWEAHQVGRKVEQLSDLS